jgi:hypothetical protein
MKKILFILILILLTTNIYSLKILEPIYKDLKIESNVKLGYFSAGEFFMVSFLLEENEDYHTISVNTLQEKDVIIEPTKKTQESIFTIIRLQENLSGEYDLKLNLLSDTSNREITLKLYITDDVIHSQLINYNADVFYDNLEEITLNLINKSNTTKRVTISSDLPDNWLRSKNRYPKEIQIPLKPNSISEHKYYYFPKEIGTKNITLKIISNDDIENATEIITYNLDVTVKKDLKSIYGSKNHTYPLFNFNLIPIYFFNKIIKTI